MPKMLTFQEDEFYFKILLNKLWRTALPDPKGMVEFATQSRISNFISISISEIYDPSIKGKRQKKG
jgi:hypothetical protein